MQSLPELPHGRVQAGVAQLLVYVHEGGQHEVSLRNAHVGDRQVRCFDNGVVIEKDVKIDFAGTVTDRLRSSERIFGLLDRRQQFLR